MIRRAGWTAATAAGVGPLSRVTQAFKLKGG